MKIRFLKWIPLGMFVGLLLWPTQQVIAQKRCGQLCDYFFMKKASVKQVVVLLRKGYSPNALGRLKVTPLHVAASNNPHPEVIYALVGAGGKVNQLDVYGVSPIHNAATNNNPAVILALLRLRANVNAKAALDFTPLHSAALHTKNPEVIKLLIKAGGKVDARDKMGATPLHIVAEQGRYPKVMGALLLANASARVIDNAGKRASDYARENLHLRKSAEYRMLLKRGGK